MKRLDRLTSHPTSGIRPHRRRLFAGGVDGARHRLSRPRGGNPRHERTQLSGSDEPQRVNRELLEVRDVNLPPLRQIKIRVLGSRKRPLDNGMRHMEAIAKGPVAPVAVLRQQTGQDVDVRFLDHARYIVSSIDTRYATMCGRLPQPLAIRVVAIGLLKDEDRVYLQPQVVIPPPAEPKVVLGPTSSKKPWLMDGEGWHLEERSGPEGREILERVIHLIATEIPAAEGPSWSQKLYISWAWNGKGWAFLHSGAKRAVLDLKKINLSPEKAAERLGYSLFDEDADLKDKFALGSSVASHNDGLRITLKSKEDVDGEKGASLAALLRDGWEQMTGESPNPIPDHSGAPGMAVELLRSPSQDPIRHKHSKRRGLTFGFPHRRSRSSS